MVYSIFIRPITVLVDLSHPSWTSDGKEIVFQRMYYRKRWPHRSVSGEYSVLKVGSDGGRPAILVENAWNCGCSPKLPLVAFVTTVKCPDGWRRNPDEIWITDLKTKKKWKLASNSYTGTDDKTIWCWSPSGEQILYQDHDTGWYVGDPWGKERVDLCARIFPSHEYNVMACHPYWGKDGFIYLRMDIQAPGKPFGARIYGRVYRIDPNTWQLTEKSKEALQERLDQDRADAAKDTDARKAIQAVQGSFYTHPKLEVGGTVIVDYSGEEFER
jgi:Tol biopolymer transport system component